jgi:hypothetical protein
MNGDDWSGGFIWVRGIGGYREIMRERSRGIHGISDGAVLAAAAADSDPAATSAVTPVGGRPRPRGPRVPRPRPVRGTQCELREDGVEGAERIAASSGQHSDESSPCELRDGADLDAVIKELVDAAPPLTGAQRDTLALLLRRPRRR